MNLKEFGNEWKKNNRLLQNSGIMKKKNISLEKVETIFSKLETITENKDYLKGKLPRKAQLVDAVEQLYKILSEKIEHAPEEEIKKLLLKRSDEIMVELYPEYEKLFDPIREKYKNGKFMSTHTMITHLMGNYLDCREKDSGIPKPKKEKKNKKGATKNVNTVSGTGNPTSSGSATTVSKTVSNSATTIVSTKPPLSLPALSNKVEENKEENVKTTVTTNVKEEEKEETNEKHENVEENGNKNPTKGTQNLSENKDQIENSQDQEPTKEGEGDLEESNGDNVEPEEGEGDLEESNDNNVEPEEGDQNVNRSQTGEVTDGHLSMSIVNDEKAESEANSDRAKPSKTFERKSMPPVIQEKKAKKPFNWKLLLIVGGIGIVAVLILMFFMRKRSTPTTPTTTPTATPTTTVQSVTPQVAAVQPASVAIPTTTPSATVSPSTTTQTTVQSQPVNTAPEDIGDYTQYLINQVQQNGK